MKRMLIVAAVATACIVANGETVTVTQRTVEFEYPRKSPPLTITLHAEPLTLTQETAPEVKKLQRRLDELEKEVAKLKNELATRPLVEGKLLYGPTLSPETYLFARPPGPGPWRQINGMTYYIVPLAQSARTLAPTPMNNAQTGVVSSIEVMPRGVIKTYRPVEIGSPELLNPSK